MSFPGTTKSLFENNTNLYYIWPLFTNTGICSSWKTAWRWIFSKLFWMSDVFKNHDSGQFRWSHAAHVKKYLTRRTSPWVANDSTKQRPLSNFSIQEKVKVPPKLVQLIISYRQSYNAWPKALGHWGINWYLHFEGVRILLTVVIYHCELQNPTVFMWPVPIFNSPENKVHDLIFRPVKEPHTRLSLPFDAMCTPTGNHSSLPWNGAFAVLRKGEEGK